MPRTFGMTLIEVMVALVLLSMLSVGLFSSFSIGQRTYTQLVRSKNEGDELMFAQQFLRRLIETAYPIHPQPLQPSYGIEGQSDAFEVTAPAPGNNPAGFFRYHIFVSVHGDGHRSLVVEYGRDQNGKMAPTLSGTASEPFRDVLISDIQEMEISYLDRTDSLLNYQLGQQNRWIQEWQQREKLPTMIKIVVRFGINDSRKWPVLTAMPVITDNVHCEFDSVSQTCRSTS